MRLDRVYSAFTYIETTIVLGIFAISAFLLVPLSFSQLSSNRVSFHASDIASWVFSMQQDSFTQKEGSAHGIRFEEESFYIFTGSSYETSIHSTRLDLNNGVEISELSLNSVETGEPTDTLLFPRGDIKPTATGTIQLSDGRSSYKVTINKEGVVYYEKE